jgi:hypothetical protein
MKFLLALSVLASTSVFAGGDKIKCYESAQQNGYGEPAFVFEANRNDYPVNRQISLVYPDHIQLERDGDCLESKHGGPGSVNDPKRFKACLTEGQQIGRLVPVEIDYENEEDTYYCQRDILDYLGDDDLM